jgi:hypothetical protein
MTVQRAAVLIGVTKSGTLPVLRAVESGIAEMEAWANSQGITGERLVVLTDKTGSVRVHQIVDAIEKLVNAGDIDQLIVYFSGHGINNRGDLWLLSEAPSKSNEAVNVEGSVQTARYCGVGHVVFISDACRTAADGIQAQGVVGTDIFPNDPVDGIERPVDIFFSCARGKPSLEVRDPGISASTFSAIYTQVMSQLLMGKDASAIDYVKELAGDVGVVHVWKLADEVQVKVPPLLKAMLGKDPTVNQIPDFRICSRATWLSRFPVGSINLAPANPPSDAYFSPSFITNRKILSQSLLDASSLAEAVLPSKELNSDFRSLQLTVNEVAVPIPSLYGEIACGFRLKNARAKHVYSWGFSSRLLGSEGTLIVAKLRKKFGNVLIVLANGCSVAMPAIAGFICDLTFDGDELINVSYEPSDANWRQNDFSQHKEEIRVLRSSISAASALGIFQLTGENAFQLAKRIQYAKSVDPSLALYAAYAYQDLGKRDLIQRMQRYLLDDLGATFFDIALLAADDEFKRLKREDEIMSPFPLLSQGWSLLQAFRAPVGARVLSLRAHLIPSLWTVFDPAGTKNLVTIFQKGDF